MYSHRTALGSLTLFVALATSARAQAPLQTTPFDRVNLDTSVAACQDFYQFANGGWLHRAKIPGDYPTYSALDQMFDQNQELLRTILDSRVVRVKSGHYKPGTGERTVVAFYTD